MDNLSYYSIPTIRIESDDENEFFGLPRKLIWKNKKWLYHVHCDGSVFHVVSYYLIWDGVNKKVAMPCSEKNCIMNAPVNIQIEAWKLCRDNGTLIK